MSESEAIAALDRILYQVKAIRAMRWLAQWPEGNCERPNPPQFVVEFLKRQAQSAKG